MNSFNKKLIYTHNLSRSFNGHVAVNSICLDVKAGSIYGFLGENGAGKTTTIRMLLGLIKPDHGDIEIFGKDIFNNRESILKRTGSLVEMPSLYSHLTGRENLEISRRLLDCPKSSINKVLKIVRLEAQVGKLVKNYSLGMRQRLGIALALLRDPSLLILDEPTNGLDPSGIQEIRELIKTFPEKFGITVFISSHLLSEVELMATHIGIINNGNLVFQDTLDKLIEISHEVIEIRVNDAEKAIHLIKDKTGYHAEIKESQVVIASLDAIDPAGINRILVEAGFEVSGLIRKKPNLEEIFLQLTNNHKNGTV